MADGHQHTPSEPLFSPGSRVDSFWVLRLIGRGGMGEVYLARDTKLGRKVALKVIHPDHLGSKKAVEDFLLEARATARFNHPHIVTIYAVGEHRGLPYVALEYLNGQTLRKRMREDRPSVQESVHIGLAIAEALEEAHRSEVLHRDLKPENVFLSLDGRLRVIDFGLAELVASQGVTLAQPEGAPPGPPPPLADRSTLVESPLGRRKPPVGSPEVDQLADTELNIADELSTLVRERPDTIDERPEEALGAESTELQSSPRWLKVRGTPSYLSPEQWLNRPSTTASDVWSFGVILHELVCGKRPYPEVPAEALKYVVSDPAPVPRRLDEKLVPPQLAHLIYRCLEKNPARRPSASELVRSLGDLTSRANDPPPRPAEEESPFRGLLPFDEEHAELFFGRDAEANAFVERLRREPVLPVVGPSGAGKSSLVQAGVLPRLRLQGKWVVHRLRPGGQPFRALAARLRPGSPEEQQKLAAELQQTPELLAVRLLRMSEEEQARVLLIVDQLEELYTLSDDECVRESFMRAICGGADDPFGPVRVVFTLRDDFLGSLAATPAAREALSHIVVVRSPDAEGLREAVERPLAQRGYHFEDEGLASRMVAAVRGEPACLPVLEFALTQLWERRDRVRRIVPRGVYEAIGGVEGALARHADALLEGLSPLQERLARGMLLRLVTPERTRRALPRRALLQDLGADAAGVLDRLTSGRVLLARRGGTEEDDQAILELAHESLIERWERLRSWIEESQEERGFLAELEQAAVLWEKRGCRPEEVWRGDALRDAFRRAQRSGGEVPELTRRFIARGMRLERARTLRRRLLVAGAFAVVLLTATVLALQNREARLQRHRAEAQRAEAQRHGARAALTRAAMLEARAQLRSSLETEDSLLGRALWRQLDKDPLRWRRRVAGYVYAISASPDGERLAVASHDRAVLILDRYSRVARVLRGHDGPVLHAAFAPDGKRLAAGTAVGTIFLWDLASGSAIRLLGHQAALAALAFSPDASLLASGGLDRLIRLWDLRSGEPLRTLTGHQARVMQLTFTPDGKLLLSSATDRSVRFWDPARGSQVSLISLAPKRRPYARIAVHPNGQRLAVSQDEQVRFWNLATGTWERAITPGPGIVNVIQYSPDGALLAIGGADRRVLLLDAAGKVRWELTGHRSAVRDLTFLPGRKALASLGMDQSVRLWDVEGSARVDPRRGHNGQTLGISFSPDDRSLASSSNDGTVRIWDVATGAERRAISAHSDFVHDVRYSPDGTVLASAGQDKMVRIWSSTEGTPLASLSGHTDSVRSLGFSIDGRLLASGGGDGTTHLWDTRDWALVHRLRTSDVVSAVAFAPSGETVATTGRDNAVRLFDVASGRELKTLRGPTLACEGLVYHPSGESLFTASMDRSLWQWNLRSGLPEPAQRFDSIPYRIDISPDGARVGIPLSDGSARVWNRTARSSLVLRGHTGEVNFFRFDHRGHRAATSSDDGTIRVWDVATGRPWWRGPLMLGRPARLLTHRGWLDLDTDRATPAGGGPAWRRAAEERARLGSLSPDGRLLCFRTDDETVELWDLATDRRLVARQLPGLTQALAVPGGCVTLAARSATLHTAGGERVRLQSEAEAVAWDRDATLVAARASVFVHDAAGRLRRSVKTGSSISAMARIGRWLVLGFQNGSIELRSLESEGSQQPPSFTFEDAPSSPVLRLIEGPMQTVIAAFANGLVGIWSLENGTRLEHARIHGPVVHLLLEGDRLYAASELGDHLVLELGVFHQDYCALLREVWKNVPAIWENGLPVLTPAPQDHPCSVRR